MRLSYLEGRDLRVLERRYFRSDVSTLSDAVRKGMLVRPDEGEDAIDLAVYDVSDGQLTLEVLRARDNDLEIARLLLERLRSVAAENQARGIWLIGLENPEAAGFYTECGFRQLGFYRMNPADPASSRMGYWKLR